MKKIYFLLLLPLAITGICNAQQDMSFETGGQGPNYTWNVFENDMNPAVEFVANPNPAAPNTSGTVAKFTALVSGQPWAGTETNHDNGMSDFVLDAAHSTIKIMVYKSVISPVGIKLVTPTGAALPEKKVTNTLINQWEELTFDFSDHVGWFTEPFDQIVVFPDFTNGPRPATNTIYFDNITFGVSDITPPNEPMTAAPDPTLPQAQVISLFSGVYANVPVDTWLTSWSAATMSEVAIQGNATKKYMNLNYAGVETVATQIDATEMTHFNVHVWSSDFTQFRIKLVDFGANGVYNGTPGDDDEEHEVVYEAPAQAGWITYHIPLSDFTGLITRENIAQLIFSSNGTSTVYIDNVYFSNETMVEPEEPMVAAPDPTLPQAQVISLFSGVYSNVPVDTFLTSWSAATMEEVMIQGNATKKYINLNYAGTETVASQIDVTGMMHFNFNAWSADFTQLRVKLVDFGADAAFGGGDDKEHEVVYEAPAQGEWITYHIPLSDFTGLITKENIAQLIFSSNGTSTVYIDNIYFSTDSTAGVEGFATSAFVMYPNPASEMLTIRGNDVIEDVVVYNTLGQQVLRATPSATESQLNVSQLQSGIYVITTKINGASSTQKFIKK